MRSVLLGAGLVALASSTFASVEFCDWRESSFREVVDSAARSRKPVVLIVTQPDWCPPCIKIDRRWLKNAADTEVAEITKDVVVLEVRGYERDGAKLLRKEGILFQGTPTVHVFAAPLAGKPLGKAPLLGSIVGAPEDFPARLAALLSSQVDPILALRQVAEAAADPLARAKALLDLARLLAERGDAAGAHDAYQSVETGPAGPSATEEQATELAELQRKAVWEQASVAMLRVRKDYRRALQMIDSWAARHGVRPDEAASFAYARAWALVHLGRRGEALDELTKGLPRDADGTDTFLYFCFRSDDRELWKLGEASAREALELYPDAQAMLWQDLGRIQRRLGALDEAEASFEKAVESSPPGEDRDVYEGQLETVRAERAR